MQGHVRRTAAEDDITEYTAGKLVDRLVRTFPHLLNDSEPSGALFHRRAQLVAEEVHHRFGSSSAKLNFTDIAALSCGADSETCSALVREGVVVLGDKLASEVRRGHELKAHSPAEVAMRLAAAKACVLIAEKLVTNSEEHVTSAQFWRHLCLLAQARDENKKKELQKQHDLNHNAGDAKVTELSEDDLMQMVCKDTLHY